MFYLLQVNNFNARTEKIAKGRYRYDRMSAFMLSWIMPLQN
jgi:hypothetical protein